MGRRRGHALIEARRARRELVRSRGIETPTPPFPVASGAARAATAMWTALIVLALLRAVLAFVPSMWGWGGNQLRFLPPLTGWLPWLVAALALVPAVSRPLAPVFERAGSLIERRPAPATLLFGLLGAACVLAFPDRLYFIGDYALRLGAARGEISPERVFPQVLPLDRWLHYELPVAFKLVSGLDPEITERIAGALKAAGLAAIAVAFARALRLRGAAATAAACVVFGGGYLGLLTGYGKAFCELMLVAGVVGVCGMELAQGRGAPLALGVALAIGFALHRSALALIVPAGAAWVLWLRAGGRWRTPAALAGLALPVISLAFALPGMIPAMKGIDREHFALAAAVSGNASLLALRGADLANQLWLLAPLAPLVPVLALPLFPQLARRRDGWLVTIMALSLLAVMLVVQPRQGLFRDLDVFAPVGVAVAMAAAWLVGETLRDAPGRAWLAPAVALATLVPSVQWLAQGADSEAALRRIRTYLHEPPPRSISERAFQWGWIGGRALSLQKPAEAAAAYNQAVALAPNPSFLFQCGLAEAECGRYPEAAKRFAAAAARAPGRPDMWMALAGVSMHAGDRVTAKAAAESTLLLRPGTPAAIEILNALARGDSMSTRIGS